MAAELCRVSLWLEALEPGKPLSFLDHHIRVGNSLLGTTPELIAAGLPDDAFKPIEGDDNAACAELKKRNRAERRGWGPLFARQDAETQARLQQAAAALDEFPDDRPEEVLAKELTFRRYERTEEYLHKKKIADALCAAFVIHKYFPPHLNDPRFPAADPFGLTQGHLNGLAASRPLSGELDADVEGLSGRYQFFHWQLVFPEVFARGGFDCVLGNPPWERVKLQEKEWFAERRPEIANAPSAAVRRRLMEQLKTDDPTLYQQFLGDLRKAEGESHLLRNSGLYPLCGRGDINVYTVFAEGMRNLINSTGRVGCVLPTGIATDDTTKIFFQDVIDKKSLACLFDFENRLGLFPDVDSRMKFCLFTTGRGIRPTAEIADFVFFAQEPDDLRDLHRRYSLSREDIQILNPNTLTCPVFRTRADAELCLIIHRRIPVFRHESSARLDCPWACDLERGFRQGEDAESLKRLGFKGNKLLFSCDEVQGAEGFVPLIEGKTFDFFDHRAASIILSESALFRPRQPVDSTLEQHRDPFFRAVPYFWVQADVARAKFPWSWFVAQKKVTSATNERTMIATILGACAVNDTVHVFSPSDLRSPTDLLPLLCANLCSFALDYLGRQKLGGNAYSMFLIKQLPLLPPVTYDSSCAWSSLTLTINGWMLPRVLELTYTAWDLEPFAQDCGWSGPPFRWDEERRFLLRCELDAAFFHLYLPADINGNWQPAENETREDLARLKASFPTPRDAVPYIMDTFPIVKRKDEAQWGTYRTKDTILEIYDAMVEAIRTGRPYQTRLDPPPADPRCCHPPRENEIRFPR
jgi:hypothetical protein